MAIEGIPSEMLAVQVTELHKPYKIHKIPTPQSLKPWEILLKTAVASLCHTDSMVVEGKFSTKLPCTASHEGTGTIAALGSKVTGFSLGERIMAGLPKGQCDECINCKGPDYWKPYCENLEGHIGVMIDGAFAEYFLIDSRAATKVPDTLSLISAAPLACAGITIYRTVLESHVEEGGWLAIVGSGGGLGHLGIKMALAKGINVIGIDARDGAIELSKKAGCKHVLDARKGKEEVVKQVQDLTSGLGVEATINVSDHETAAALACAVTRVHGRMVQVAQPDQVCVPFQELIFRDIRIVGSLIAGRDQAQDMLNLVAKHKIKVETNLFHGLSEVPKMVELAHSGKMKGKAVVVIDEEVIAKEKGVVDC